MTKVEEYNPTRKLQRVTSQQYDLRQERQTPEDLTPNQAAALLWRIGDLSWKLWDQTQVIYTAIRELPPNVTTAVVLCARQFSKSVLGVCMALEDCIWYPNTCTLIVGPTLKQTKDIVNPRVKLLQNGMPEGFIRQSKSDNKWLVGPKECESELVISGFDSNSSSQRGKTVKNIYIEEIVDASPDSFNDSMKSDLGPALLHSKSGRLTFLTTPPKIPQHPFNTEWIPRAKVSKSFYKFTIDDNTEISREQYLRAAELSGCKIVNGVIVEESVDWRREFKCEIIRDERVTVIPKFERERHVKNFEAPSDLIYETVIDFGGTVDLTVALFQGYDYNSDMVLWIDERWFPRNTSTSVIVREIREMEREWRSKGRRVAKRYADASGQLLIDLRQDFRFPVQMPKKSDWQANVNNLNNAFFRDKALVHERCEMLATTLENGQLTDNRKDFLRTEIMGHCDAIAAAMYGWRCVCKDDPYSFHKEKTDEQIDKMAEPGGGLSNDQLAEIASEIMQGRTGFKGFSGGINRRGFGKFKR